MAASLVNLLGFTTGAILYAMLLWMVLRSSSDRLSLLTGAFGLIWNVGAFSGYGLYTIGLVGPSPILMAVAFSSLGFLPAVVVHSVLRARGISGSAAGRGILLAAYALSSIASVMNLQTAVMQRIAPSQTALKILTAGFALVMIALLFKTRKLPGWGQALWVVALAVFGVSTLHLSNHRGTDPWWLELIGHHASLPLALAFLHQDYRFALADIFLKRAVALVLLVSLVFGIYVGLTPLTGSTGVMDQQSVLIVLALWVATALVYPWIRSTSSWFVDNVVLHRPDYDMLLAEASRTIGSHESVEGILDEIRQLVGPALSARSVQWSENTDIDFHHTQNLVVTTGRSAVATIPTAEAPRYSLSIGELEGGRRLLSDDIAVIERIALLTARRIDVVRTAQERLERNTREREMSRLAAEAELRALRAQIQPHFLFNALTTIGYLIQAAPDRALSTLLRLSGLLRSVLRAAPEFSTLGEELEIIVAYLEIERARFEDRLAVIIAVPKELQQLRIPTLLLQPIVENAVKHGISKSILGGEVHITAELLGGDVKKSAHLRLSVEDTGAGSDDARFAAGRNQGVGLNNVERRLKCYGGDLAKLQIRSRPGRGTLVELILPAESMLAAAERADAVTAGNTR